MDAATQDPGTRAARDETPEGAIAARVRAAIAYSTLSVPVIAERAEIGEATLRRIISPSAPRGADTAVLWRIADACEVPRPWVDVAWMSDTGEQTVAEIKTYEGEPPQFGRGTAEQRLEIIEHYLAALLTLEAGRSRTSGDYPMPPPPPAPRSRARQASDAGPRRIPQAPDSARAANDQN